MYMSSVQRKCTCYNPLHMLYTLAPAVPTDIHLQQITISSKLLQQHSSHITASTQSKLAHLRNDDILIHPYVIYFNLCLFQHDGHTKVSTKAEYRGNLRYGVRVAAMLMCHGILIS